MYLIAIVKKSTNSGFHYFEPKPVNVYTLYTVQKIGSKKPAEPLAEDKNRLE